MNRIEVENICRNIANVAFYIVQKPPPRQITITSQQQEALRRYKDNSRVCQLRDFLRQHEVKVEVRK